MSDSLQSYGLLWPWNSSGKNTGVGCHALLQGSSWHRDQTHISCSPGLAGEFFTTEPPGEGLFPSIRIFSSELGLHIKWPKDWSFRFSSSPSKEYSRLISCRIDWFTLLAFQGTLKSLLQHHNLKKSILQYSAFFMFYYASLQNNQSYRGQTLKYPHSNINSLLLVINQNLRHWVWAQLTLLCYLAKITDIKHVSKGTSTSSAWKLETQEAHGLAYLIMTESVSKASSN